MQSFRVLNIEKHRHYKDRRPDWIKLGGDVVGKRKFIDLPDASKAHVIQLWLLANRGKNIFPYDATWIGGCINATETVDLDILVEHGFIEIIKS